MVAVAAVNVGVTLWNNKKNRDQAEELAEDANEKQTIETAKLDKAKAEYKAMKFTNPYENMENVYEDLTVNQQQAQFQARQGAQQRANIMQNLQGAAGGSGIAGLAQAMANQGQLQTQQISASIGQQEAANRRAMASQAAKIQAAELGGEQWIQEQEIAREQTLLGMQMGGSAAANLGAQNAALNQLQVDAAGRDATAGAIGQLGGAIAGGDYSGLSKKKIDPNLSTYSTRSGNEPIPKVMETPEKQMGITSDEIDYGFYSDYSGGFGKQPPVYDANGICIANCP